MSRPVLHVVSHGPYCLDGVAAAAAIARFHEDAEVKTRFASNQEVDALLREVRPKPGEELWITDISWSDPETEDHLRRLIDSGVVVRWFDHHRTAIERLARGGYRLPFATRVVRDEFAASKLVFDYLQERAAEAAAKGGHVPPERFRSFAPVVAMADDNDRWLHKIPGSRELGLVLRAMAPGEAYRSFLELDESVSDTPEMAAARTRVREDLARNRRLAETTRSERRVGAIRLVSALCDGYPGEIGDEWGKTSPESVFVFFDVRSQALSFRRSSDFDFDLSKLAEACGGGGHPAAAGATMKGLAEALGELIGSRVAERMAS
jgi:oligoribonuclease NrnB/cAMP/cGMP phosphodiesterase (DHH superfamily)